MMLNTSAVSAPMNEPTNSDGAKVPPTPPAELVAAIATTLNSIVATTNRITTHSIELNLKNNELSNNECVSPLISAVIAS